MFKRAGETFTFLHTQIFSRDLSKYFQRCSLFFFATTKNAAVWVLCLTWSASSCRLILLHWYWRKLADTWSCSAVPLWWRGSWIQTLQWRGFLVLVNVHCHDDNKKNPSTGDFWQPCEWKRKEFKSGCVIVPFPHLHPPTFARKKTKQKTKNKTLIQTVKAVVLRWEITKANTKRHLAVFQ